MWEKEINYVDTEIADKDILAERTLSSTFYNSPLDWEPWEKASSLKSQ